MTNIDQRKPADRRRAFRPNPEFVSRTAATLFRERGQVEARRQAEHRLRLARRARSRRQYAFWAAVVGRFEAATSGPEG